MEQGDCSALFWEMDMNFVSKLNRIVVVTGHYGSGKTNFAVNLAVFLAKQGKKVRVADLDLVNPYFRTADFVELFGSLNIDLVAPAFANSNLDLPSVSREMERMFAKDIDYAIIDVGGDDAGAFALGRFAAQFQKDSNQSVLYVINCFRHLTQTSDDAVAYLKEIEYASRLKADFLVNNSNIAGLTTETNIVKGINFTEETSQKTGLPILCHAVERGLLDQITNKPQDAFGVEIYVRALWDEKRNGGTDHVKNDSGFAQV